MVAVYLGLGSNHEREQQLRVALDALQQQFGAIRVSPVFESEPLGQSAAPYFNLVVEIATDVPVGRLKALLRRIEDAGGRLRDAEKSLLCPLDIDILLYGNAVGNIDGVSLPRHDILTRAYVLLPLSLLAPDLVHPQLHHSIGGLWGDFDKSQQPLRAVDFVWPSPLESLS